MTPPRDPAAAVQAPPAFASTRPGSSRRDQTGWVPLHKATHDLVSGARRLRGAFVADRGADRGRARRPE
ncbi:hypothetical protein PVT71_07970 [Salipiger sp. H15]|uniref:Uncharacterized protein n=1 Tax=Alloyangia sp. H15 TaxID=3029062 RepID=A0AAU8ADA3_9RHOB